MALFAVLPIPFVWGEFVFIPTALYVVHLLKVHCHSVSLGKLYKLNVWTVPLSKVKALFAFMDHVIGG